VRYVSPYCFSLRNRALGLAESTPSYPQLARFFFIFYGLPFQRPAFSSRVSPHRPFSLLHFPDFFDKPCSFTRAGGVLVDFFVPSAKAAGRALVSSIRDKIAFC